MTNLLEAALTVHIQANTNEVKRQLRQVNEELLDLCMEWYADDVAEPQEEGRGMTDTTKRIQAVRAVARRNGYAIGVHGSERRDLDLIAAPWIENCSTTDELVNDIADTLDLVVIRGPVEKPHGRVGFILRRLKPEPTVPQPIDLSVLGCREGRG